MENKTFTEQERVVSLKRIEFILEEILLTYISNSTEKEENIKENHLGALSNIDMRMKDFFESLPNAK